MPIQSNNLDNGVPLQVIPEPRFQTLVPFAPLRAGEVRIVRDNGSVEVTAGPMDYRVLTAAILPAVFVVFCWAGRFAMHLMQPRRFVLGWIVPLLAALAAAAQLCRFLFNVGREQSISADSRIFRANCSTLGDRCRSIHVGEVMKLSVHPVPWAPWVWMVRVVRYPGWWARRQKIFLTNSFESGIMLYGSREKVIEVANALRPYVQNRPQAPRVKRGAFWSCIIWMTLCSFVFVYLMKFPHAMGYQFGWGSLIAPIAFIANWLLPGMVLLATSNGRLREKYAAPTPQ